MNELPLPGATLERCCTRDASLLSRMLCGISLCSLSRDVRCPGRDECIMNCGSVRAGTSGVCDATSTPQSAPLWLSMSAAAAAAEEEEEEEEEEEQGGTCSHMGHRSYDTIIFSWIDMCMDVAGEWQGMGTCAVINADCR